MEITDAFLGEHGALYALFDVLKRSLASANALDSVRTWTALLGGVLVSHAQLEDDLLFTSLDPHLGPLGPLAVMRSEHEQIEALIAQASSYDDLNQARDALLGAVELALDHFAKEEQVLFRIARQALEGPALMSLGAEWARRRGVSIVDGR